MEFKRYQCQLLHNINNNMNDNRGNQYYIIHRNTTNITQPENNNFSNEIIII